MPSGRDWIELLRSTFHGVGREDLKGLYTREWKDAKGKLIAEDRERIEGERRRWKRFFKTANSVLFGLARRLAPARRVVFLAVLVCFFLSLSAPKIERHRETLDHGARKTFDYRIEFDSGFLSIASLLLMLLLAMELVDKINYRDELELARDLQASLIPKQLPEPPGFRIGAHNEIANTVGGDIYDFIPLPDGRLAILFGDASGHGMAAGLVMAVAHAAFRTQLDVDPSPPAMFATLNRILCRTGSPRAFFSCAYFLLSEDGSYTASLAGHPQALRLGPDGAVRERIGKGAYPLGIRTGMSWAVERGKLEPGESLFLNSDGLSEARDETGAEFGDERIEVALRRGAGLDPERLTGSIALALHEFRRKQAPEDDVSIALIRRDSSPA